METRRVHVGESECVDEVGEGALESGAGVAQPRGGGEPGSGADEDAVGLAEGIDEGEGLLGRILGAGGAGRFHERSSL